MTLVARPGRSTTDELLAALGEESGLAGRWSPYAVRMAEGGEPGALTAVQEGRAGVQDEGSQLVAAALAQAPVEGRDSRWLDGCAG
ncbi:16S rRNA (cytosine967-C5)-methyltransferase, partial [Streptomyces sp. DpondAA-F4a]